MIIDTFIFNDEIDILKIRLDYLSPVVDKFILCEATMTHSNQSKALHFKSNKSIFSDYSDKLIHIIYDGPYSSSAWDNEQYQRNYIKNFLLNFSNGDLIYHSDVDEIPKREILMKLKSKYPTNKKQIFKFVMVNYFHSCNYISGRNPVWKMGSGFFFDLLNTNLDESQFLYNDFLKPKLNSDTSLMKIRLSHGNKFLAFAGWHISYFLNDVEFLNKLQSFAHYDEIAFDEIAFKNIYDIQRIIEKEVDVQGVNLIKLGHDFFSLNSIYPSKLVFSNDRIPIFKLVSDIYIFNFVVLLGVYDIYKLFRRKLRVIKFKL